MKHLILLSLFVMFACSSVRADGERFPSDQRKPYERVLVMPGSGFNSTIFLGMYEALVEAGKAPDLIISSCGGSLAAPLIAALQDPGKIKELVRSKTYYEAIKRVTINNGSVVSALGTVLKAMKNRITQSRTVPNFFDGVMLNVPRGLLSENFPGFQNSFPHGKVHLVVMATRTSFGPEDVGSSAIPEYFETAFTDKETAEYLRHASAGPHLSGIGRSSFLAENVEAVSGVPLEDATRASIADPYYMAPMSIRGFNYITGAADLYPLELAHDLAREVVMPYPGKFDTFIEQNVFAAVFGFSANKRLKEVRAESADTWVDISDDGEALKRFNMDMNPRPNYLKLSIQLGVPETFEEFQRVIDRQWEWGYVRAKEALAVPAGSKAHVRMP